MSFDMNKLMQQAAQMQEQMQRMQEEAKKETAEAEGPAGEDAILELMKETLDAKERGES